MATGYVDPGLQHVLENVNTVVASEGGSLELLEVRDSRLVVRYNKGRNDECPECVPDHDLVRQMMRTSLGVYAPYIKDIELT